MCVVVVVEKKFKRRERKPKDVFREKNKKTKKKARVEREIFERFLTSQRTHHKDEPFFASLSHQQQHPFNAFTKVTSDTKTTTTRTDEYVI